MITKPYILLAFMLVAATCCQNCMAQQPSGVADGQKEIANADQADSVPEKLKPQWVRRWQGNAAGKGPNNAWDVLVYRDRIYATGVKTDSLLARTAPLVLRAYTPDGELVWEKTWKGYKGKMGTGGSGTVLIGHGDFLYLGGVVTRDNMNASLLQKWDLDGNLIWTRHWGDKKDGGHHEVNGLAIVDNALYVSHYSAAPGMITIDAHIKKFDLAKLDQRGPLSESLLWDRTYGKPDSHNTTDGHIHADRTGVFIAGQYGGLKGRNVYNEGDAYLIKFDPAGKQQWMKLYTGNGTGTDNAFNLKSDGEFIYTTGPTMTKMKKKIALGIPLGVEIQVFVQKYTTDGELVWTKLYGGPKIEYSRGLAVDDDYIYVSATTKSYVEPRGKDNTLLLKIDKKTGHLINQHIWGGLGLDGATTSISQDRHGSLYLSGHATSSDDGTDTGKKSAVILKVKP